MLKTAFRKTRKKVSETCISWGLLSPVYETDFKRYHNILKWIHIKQNYHIVVFNFANGKKSLQTHTTQCFWHPPPKRSQSYISQVHTIKTQINCNPFLFLGRLGRQASTENFRSFAKLPYFFIFSWAKQIQTRDSVHCIVVSTLKSWLVSNTLR